ncbi:hypothetical protein PFHG_05603, partial [Plasmodium falciparum HB3]
MLLTNTVFPRKFPRVRGIIYIISPEPHTFMFLYTDDNFQYQNEVFLKQITFSDNINWYHYPLGGQYNNIDLYKNDVHDEKERMVLHINDYYNGLGTSRYVIGKDFYVDHLIMGDSKDSTSNMLMSKNLKYSNLPNYEKVRANYREAHLLNEKEWKNIQNGGYYKTMLHLGEDMEHPYNFGVYQDPITSAYETNRNDYGFTNGILTNKILEPSTSSAVTAAV